MMDYRKMTREELEKLKFQAILRGNANACVEISDFLNYYGKTVTVVKGRKVPHGVTGKVFWLKRYDYSKYGDPWGIYSTTKIGIRTFNDDVFFTAVDNVKIIENED